MVLALLNKSLSVQLETFLKKNKYELVTFATAGNNDK
jgi:hypothetical protein